MAIAVQNMPQAGDEDEQEQAVVGLDPNLTQLQPAYAYYSIIGTFILGAFTSTLVELKLRHRGKDYFGYQNVFTHLAALQTECSKGYPREALTGHRQRKVELLRY